MTPTPPPILHLPKRSTPATRNLFDMVLEIAQFDVTSDQEDEFVDAYRAARNLVADTPGCRSVRMTRGVESPSRFTLLVEWDTIEAHEEGFRASERFTAWRERIGTYFASPPVVEHYIDVD